MPIVITRTKHQNFNSEFHQLSSKSLDLFDGGIETIRNGGFLQYRGYQCFPRRHGFVNTSCLLHLFISRRNRGPFWRDDSSLLCPDKIWTDKLQRHTGQVSVDVLAKKREQNWVCHSLRKGDKSITDYVTDRFLSMSCSGIHYSWRAGSETHGAEQHSSSRRFEKSWTTLRCVESNDV